jgi:hypothetical protein
MSCCSNSCDNSNSSACTLKDIVNELDNLNTQDLCVLKKLVDRLVSCNS